MLDFWTISGWVGTFGFGVVTLIQAIRDYIHNRIWRERESRLRSVKNSLLQLRAMLTEAGMTGEVVKTEATMQFIRTIGHSVVVIEQQIDGMLPREKRPPAKQGDHRPVGPG